jgi:hypothetical protein
MDRPAFPSPREIELAIGPATVHTVPVPADCSDGFLGAYWRRPAHYLDSRMRGAISVFTKFDSTAGVARLRRDLEDGTWLAQHGALQDLQELDVGYRLIVARCGYCAALNRSVRRHSMPTLTGAVLHRSRNCSNTCR